MTDNEIKKALEQKIKFSKEFDESEEAIIKVNILEASFDYINRLEAENERLQSLSERLGDDVDLKLKYIYELEENLKTATAENERLNEELKVTRAYIHKNGLEWGLISHLEFYKNLKAEARKEFAERLKELLGVKRFSVIDNLLKEMEG